MSSRHRRGRRQGTIPCACRGCPLHTGLCPEWADVNGPARVLGDGRPACPRCAGADR
jgi:hypothetical protein